MGERPPPTIISSPHVFKGLAHGALTDGRIQVRIRKLCRSTIDVGGQRANLVIANDRADRIARRIRFGEKIFEPGVSVLSSFDE